MQLHGRSRLAAYFALPLSICGGFAAVSCSDTSSPVVRSTDSWAEDVTVSLSVRYELHLMGPGVMPPAQPAAHDTTVALRTFPLFSSSNRAFLRSTSGPTHPVIRTFRGAGGELYTAAIVRDNGGRPAKRLYIFKNGVVQFIYSPEYARIRNRWYRARAGLVVFDDRGQKLAQISATEKGAALVQTAGESLSRSFAPDAIATMGDAIQSRAKLIEEGESGPCSKLLRDLIAKEISVGASFVGGLITYYYCKGNDVCNAILYGLIGSFATNFNALIDTMDEYTACDLADWIRASNPTGAQYPPQQPEAPAREDATSVIATKPVEEFIVAAEASHKNSDQ